MSPEKLYPDLDQLLLAIGEAGQRMSDLKACEGAAGNISVCVGWRLDVSYGFPLSEPLKLPHPSPALAGTLVIVTGSGCRLRDISADPTGNLGVVAINEDGLTGHLYTAPNCLFQRLTGEFNSHLAAHNDYVTRTGALFHALIHAQPPYLVYLSHIPAYRDQEFFNQRLMRWEPETIIKFPEGLGVVPFLLPGSDKLMAATMESLIGHSLVMWSKHGVIARSAKSVMQAADFIEYAESAARYEYMDLAAGGKADGLTQEELRAIVEAFGVQSGLV